MTKMDAFSAISEALNLSQNFPRKSTPVPLDTDLVRMCELAVPNLKMLRGPCPVAINIIL